MNVIFNYLEYQSKLLYLKNKAYIIIGKQFTPINIGKDSLSVVRNISKVLVERLYIPRLLKLKCVILMTKVFSVRVMENIKPCLTKVNYQAKLT